jgi:hypothetical protein
MVMRNNYERNRVHKWYIDLDSLGYKVFNFTEHGEIVLGLDVFRIRGIQTCNQASERCDSDTLANTEDS